MSSINLISSLEPWVWAWWVVYMALSTAQNVSTHCLYCYHQNKRSNILPQFDDDNYTPPVYNNICTHISLTHTQSTPCKNVWLAINIKYSQKTRKSIHIKDIVIDCIT